MDFYIPKSKIKRLYHSNGNNGCFVSKRILIDGCNVRPLGGTDKHRISKEHDARIAI